MKRYYIKTKTIFYRGFTAPVKIGDDTIRIVKVHIDIRLVKFLRRHKVYSEFEREVKKYLNKRLILPHRILLNQSVVDIERMREGFSFSEASAGYEYWSRLSELFIDEGVQDADLS